MRGNPAKVVPAQGMKTFLRYETRIGVVPTKKVDSDENGNIIGLF